MKKGTILGLSIGTVLVVGAVIFLLFWKKSPLYIGKSKDDGDVDGDVDGDSGQNGGGSGGQCSDPSTGLSCRVQGDDFRKWIHRAYPRVAESFDLDESYHEYDNCFIRKVWAHQPNNASKPLGETWKSISLGWENMC